MMEVEVELVEVDVVEVVVKKQLSSVPNPPIPQGTPAIDEHGELQL
jgi:hypothetical protein